MEHISKKVAAYGQFVLVFFDKFVAIFGQNMALLVQNIVER